MVLARSKGTVVSGVSVGALIYGCGGGKLDGNGKLRERLIRRGMHSVPHLFVHTALY